MAAHSSVNAWKIPRTVEPSELQSMGSHSVGLDRNHQGHSICPSGTCGKSKEQGSEIMCPRSKVNTKVEFLNPSSPRMANTQSCLAFEGTLTTSHFCSKPLAVEIFNKAVKGHSQLSIWKSLYSIINFPKGTETPTGFLPALGTSCQAAVGCFLQG